MNDTSVHQHALPANPAPGGDGVRLMLDDHGRVVAITEDKRITLGSLQEVMSEMARFVEAVAPLTLSTLATGQLDHRA